MMDSLSDLYPERLVRIFRQQVLNNRDFPVRPPAPPMVTPLVGTHEGVSCDGCSMTAFVGNRYKCLRCSDYDLCYGCFTTNNFGDQTQIADSLAHDETHPMQLILSAVDFEAVYEGDAARRYDDRKIVSFTCPYCNITGLTDRQFGSHVTTLHQEPPNYSVICPLCIGIADMEHSISRETENLCAHWAEHHSNALDQLRADPPTTRPTQRRPMLARRNQRTAPRPIGTRLPEDLTATELTDLIRNIRPEEELRRMTELINANNTLNQASIVRQTQRLLEGRAERAPVLVEPVAPMREEQLVHQVIRPLETTSIYPPTSDDSGDETPQPAGDSVSCSVSETSSMTDEENQEDDFPVVEDAELAKDEFWKTLKSRLSADEVQLVLKSMKMTGKLKEEKDVPNCPIWKPRPLKALSCAAKTTMTSADSEGEQGWLPLVIETTPLRSTLCGGYWSDKRFLRPRKMQREQSVASSNAEIMEKAEVAMALCRANALYEPVFSDPEKPDVSLREALQHLKLGQKPTEMTEYRAAEEVIQMPDRDPITTGEEKFEMPDFTSRGYSQIVDGNVPLGVVPEADEAITNSEDDEVEAGTSGEDEEDVGDEEEDGSQDSSIPEEINIP